MRITGGSAKGRQIFCLKGLTVRPAQDKIRVSIFNILANVIEDSVVLDLFAGSGALGLEALSRGAKQCVFVEKDAKTIRVLRKNLELTGFSGNSIVLKKDAFHCIPELKEKGIKYGLVFFDPPYRLWETDRDRQELLDLLASIGKDDTLLDPQAIVIVRYRTHKVDLPEGLGGLSLFDRRVYGDTTLAFLSN